MIDTRSATSSRLAKLCSSPRLFSPRGSLATTGWLRSRWAKQPLDGDGAPIPWMTYGAIDLLDGLLTPDTTVFEFGAGNSTLWFAARARRVVSVEHDPKWVRQLRDTMPDNVTLLPVPAEPPVEYAAAWTRHGSGTCTAVVIDGRNRVECARAVAADCDDVEIVVFDNSARPHYREGLAVLGELGMRKVVFRGLAPLLTRPNETTVFFR